MKKSRGGDEKKVAIVTNAKEVISAYATQLKTLLEILWKLSCITLKMEVPKI